MTHQQPAVKRAKWQRWEYGREFRCEQREVLSQVGILRADKYTPDRL